MFDKTKIVIENKGNVPSVELYGIQVDLDHARKVATFTSLGYIQYIETTRVNRVNLTKYELPDGIFCYKRDALSNTRNARVSREMEVKIFKMVNGQMIVIGDGQSGWDSETQLRSYYNEYNQNYTFVDGESVDGSVPIFSKK